MYKTLPQVSPFLELLVKSNAPQRRVLIKSMHGKVVDFFVEVAKDILAGRIPVTLTYKKKLTNRKRDLRELASPKVKKVFKQKIIQKGGFFPLLAPIIAAIVSAAPTIATGAAIAGGVGSAAGGIANIVRAAK